MKLDRGVAEVCAHKNTCTYCTQAPLESSSPACLFVHYSVFRENEKKKRKIKLHSTIFRYFKLL